MTFNDFSFDPNLMNGLDSMGFTRPTPIQIQAIPIIQEGNDIVACAQTGTGKTAAYLLPILNKIVSLETRHLSTLIIVPTRELAQQIDQQIEGLSYFLGVSSIPVYGGGDGAAWDQQKKAMESGADIIIATPGRLIALLAGGTLNLEHLKYLVLDEADRMLDMGFFQDIVRVISYLPKERQTLLFSATMPPKIRELARKILQTPVEINLALSKPADGIDQQAYVVHNEQKLPLLTSILKGDDHNSVIVFASTKESVKKLSTELLRKGFEVKAFHSDLEQEEREIIMRDFKNKKVRTIIGTDILSRGIDVEDIGLVLNYDVPPDAEDYVHRIGRTARAERKGKAITFINDKDQRRFYSIENLIGREVPKMALPESLGEGPLYQPQLKRPDTFKKRPFGNKRPGGRNNKPQTGVRRQGRSPRH